MPMDQNTLRLTFSLIESTKFSKYREEKHSPTRMGVSPEAVARVRRALFGPPDPEGNSRFLQEQVRQLEAVEKDRWGFDFKAEAPLPGHHWERKASVPFKPRRPAQAKITDYLPSKKTADSQKRLKLILGNLQEEGGGKVLSHQHQRRLLGDPNLLRTDLNKNQHLMEDISGDLSRPLKPEENDSYLMEDRRLHLNSSESLCLANDFSH